MPPKKKDSDLYELEPDTPVAGVTGRAGHAVGRALRTG